MSAAKSKKSLIMNSSYANEEVRRPIYSKVVVDKIESLPGSTAGAGSGDFLQYRNLKKKEEARIERMEIEYRQKLQKEEFDKIRNQHLQEAIERTIKKSLKRKKKKERKISAKKTNDECKKKIKIEDSNGQGLFIDKEVEKENEVVYSELEKFQKDLDANNAINNEESSISK